MSRKHKLRTSRPPGGFCTAQVYCSSTVRFRLLELPHELILRVLQFAVIRSSPEKPITISSAFKSSGKPRVRSRMSTDRPQYRSETSTLRQPAITRTCRLLRNEGLKLFYRHNYFLAMLDPFGLSAVHKSILTQPIRCMEHFYVHWLYIDCPIRYHKDRRRADGADFYWDGWFLLRPFKGRVPYERMCIRMKEGRVVFCKVGGLDWCFQVDLAREESSREWLCLGDRPLSLRSDLRKDFWVAGEAV